MMRLRNETNMPLVIDDDGRTLDGGAICEADENNVFVRRALEAGLLFQLAEEPKPKSGQKQSPTTTKQAAGTEES